MTSSSSMKTRVSVFIFIYITYGLTYALRKPLGVVKSVLESELQLNLTMLGILDLALLLPYALVQICCSPLWVRCSSRHLIALCMLGASISMVAIGGSQGFIMLCVCLVINGMCQAPVWPACCRILDDHFAKGDSPNEQSSAVFGIIGTCNYVGAILGTAISVHIMRLYNWQFAFLPACGASVIMGILCWLCLPDDLKRGKYAEETSSMNESNLCMRSFTNLLSLWRVPGVPEVTLAAFCIKFVRYAMFMWLPLYLEEYLFYDSTQSGLLSTLFDAGGIIGPPLLGVMIDSMCSRKPMSAITSMMLLGIMALGMLVLEVEAVVNHVGMMCLLLGVIGATNCGPDALLTGSVTVALGEPSGVTSLVNGIASLGGFVEGPLVALVVENFGWTSAMFVMLTAHCIGTLAVLRSVSIIEKNGLKVSSGEKQPLLTGT